MSWLRFSVIRTAGFWSAFCLLSLFVLDSPSLGEAPKRVRTTGARVIQLPAPSTSGPVNLEEAISKRRSVRQFADKPVNFVQIGQLCWAGQGITDKQGNLRAAPSAGALYPIELYLVTPDGTFVYHPEEHTLAQVQSGDLRKQLSTAAGGQQAVAEAACDIVITGSVKKVAVKYGSKATRFMLLEAGHVSENIQLQAVTMGLGALPVGDFEIKNVERACGLPAEQEALLIVCVGYPIVQQAGKQGNSQSGSGLKKALLIVPANDYKDEELFETRRILNEASIVTTVASSKIGPLNGTSGGIVASEVTLDNVHVDDFDAVVFIGGPGASEYFINQLALNIAREADAKHKVLAAISVAPTILANAGVLRELRATGYITQRDTIQKGGAKYTGAPVERDGLIITSSGPQTVVPFAQTIIGTLNEISQRSGKTP